MAPKFKTLAADFLVSPQITVADVADAAALGVVRIINNRPEGEEPGQTSGDAVAAAAKAAGIDYVAIPISGMAVAPADIDAFDRAVAGAGGPILAYCRSGTRATVLRAFARARAGHPVAAIVDEAAEAGYDLSGLAARLAGLGAA